MSPTTLTTTELTALINGVEIMLAGTTVATETTGQFFKWLGEARAELAARDV